MIGDILQPTHLIFIFVVALLVLGPKRLPEVGRSLGKGIRDFRQAMAGIEAEASNMFSDDHQPDSTPVEPVVVQSTSEHTTVTSDVTEPQQPAPDAPTIVPGPTVVAATSRADDAS